MTLNRLDIVTVVFSADLRLLKLQARSLARFADPSLVGTIHVIVNDHCFPAVRRSFLRDVMPEYGELSGRVRLLDYRELWDDGTRKTGWLSQQALKLMAADIVETEDFLILDAKNHLIRPVTIEDFIADDGRLRSPMYRIHERYQDHFRRACAYFGFDGEPDMTEGLPTATPFLMKRSLAMQLVAEIEHREQTSFERFFMNGRPFTEFYLYYGFILGRYGSVSQFYEKRHQPTATLFAGHANDVAASSQALARLERPVVFCMGVHREVLKAGNPEVLGMVKDAWQRCGLVTEADEQAYFTTFQDRLPKWRRFLPL